MTVKHNNTVATGNIKYADRTVAVANCKLRRVMANSQRRYTLLITSKDRYLQCQITLHLQQLKLELKNT